MRMWRRQTLLSLPAVCLLALLPAEIRAQNPIVSEHNLKAAYLYHFIQFTDWPEGELAMRRALSICIRADHPLLNALRALRDKTAHGLPIALNAEPQQDLANCQVLIVTSDDRPLLTQGSAQQPLLTVSDDPQITPGEVIIRLRMKDDRVIFSINKSRAEAAGLQISSRLLRLAETVQ